MPSVKNRQVTDFDVRTMWEGLNIGLYPRLSDDPNETKAGIDRQTKDTLADATRAGAGQTTLYTESDTSAWKRRRVPAIDPATGNPTTMLRVIRPVWSQMMSDLREGKIDGAIVYNIDRLVRDMRDLEDIIDLTAETGRVIRTVTGDLNLTNDDGIAMARVAVAFASKASADTSRRVARAHKDRADAGLSVVRGKGQRAFGYNQAGDELVPGEATALREAAAGILAGSTIADVVRVWNEAGLRTTGGREWLWNDLWGVLTNPRLAGYRSTIVAGDRKKGERSHYYAVHRDDEGLEVRATWVRKDKKGNITAQGFVEPILDRDTFDRVQLVIGAIAISTDGELLRLKRTSRDGKASQLLVGLARCGVCGSRMFSQKVTLRGGEQIHRYYCPPASRGTGGRGCVVINGPSMDDDLTARYLSALIEGQAPAAAAPAVAAKIAEIDAEIAELAVLRRDGRVGVTSWALAHDELLGRRQALQAATAGDGARRSADPRVARRRLEEWAALPMEMRRRHLAKWATGGVRVMRAARPGANGYDRDRVVVVTADIDTSAASALAPV